MSIHFSKYRLNTYSAFLYFQAHVPADYPLGKVMIKSRAFRRLPARLRELAILTKRWARLHTPYPAGIDGIEQWYDDDGYELDPATGRRLTDAEIDAEWGEADPELAHFVAQDIPIPSGGFADPAKWQEPAQALDLVDRTGFTEEQLLTDIASRGREWTAGAYAVPASKLAECHTDHDLVMAILEMDGKPWPVAA